MNITDHAPGARAFDSMPPEVVTIDDAARSHELFPSPAVADVSKGRLLFALALASYAAVDFWYLRWIPIGLDSGDFWHIFYASYAELFFNNDLARWFPYGSYGQPNILYNFMELSSTDYLMMVAGKIFHVTNAMLLFQLSLMADHVLFLFGVCLIARSVFQRKSSVLLAAIASIAVLQSLQLTFIQVFRILSWYPLIAYFLLRFFRDDKPEALWSAGVVFVFWCLGNSYLPPYMALSLAPFVAVGTWKRPKAWRSLFSARARNLTMMAVCVSAAVLYMYMAREMLVDINVIRDQRSADGVVNLASFLGSRDISVFEAVVSVCSGGIFYIGLLPLALILWGVFAAKSPAFYAFLASGMLLVWFGLGGLFSLWTFHYLPFFSHTRNLYMGFYLMRAPLLLAAAAAWDVIPQKGLRMLLLTPLFVVFLVDLSLYGDRVLLVGAPAEAFANVWRAVYVRLAVYGIFVALAVAFSWRWRPAASRTSLVEVALLASLFVDVFSYSYRSGLTSKFAATYRIPPAVRPWLGDTSGTVYQAGRVRPLTWQDTRLDTPRDPRQRMILEFSPAYFNTYAYAQFDPCEPSLLVRSVSRSMAKLLSLRAKGDEALRTILGCGAPKMRLVTNAIYVDDENGAADAVRRSSDLAGTAILELPQTQAPPGARSQTHSEIPGTVAVTRFSANALTIVVRVDDVDGAWLVYADAYDARWHAWVNEQATPIVPAYVGLKAVRVPNGDSVVRMEFRGAATIGMSILASVGAICSLSLLGYCAMCCVRGFPGQARTA